MDVVAGSGSGGYLRPLAISNTEPWPDVTLCPGERPYTAGDRKSKYFAYGAEYQIASCTFRNNIATYGCKARGAYDLFTSSGHYMRRLGGIAEPAGHFVLADSFRERPNTDGSNDKKQWALWISLTGSNGAPDWGMAFRHRQKTNVLYWDGHAALLGKEEVKDLGVSYGMFGANGIYAGYSF